MIQKRYPSVIGADGRTRVLCVDDEIIIGDLIAQVLRTQLNCEVVTAANGEEALGILLESDFDVIIVDYLMPHMGGGELYRRLAPERPDLLPRMMFITGDILSETTMSEIASTGLQYLEKPFELTELVEATRGLLTEQREHKYAEETLPARVAG